MKSIHDPFDLRCQIKKRITMAALGVFARIVARHIGVDAAAPPRLPFVREKVRSDALEQAANLGIAEAVEIAQASHLAREQLISPVGRRPVCQESIQAATYIVEHAVECFGRAPADEARRQVRRSARQETVERSFSHEPPVEKQREPLARARNAKLREDESDVVVLLGQADQDSQRSIESLLDDAWHFGLVRHLEARIQISFERELAQQRKAERIDRADRDLTQSIVQLRPACAVNLAFCRSVPQLRDDALAHLGSSFSRERDGQDVGRFHPLLHEVHVARHEHRRLAGAGRCFQDDVIAWVDRERASFSVRRQIAIPGFPIARRVEEQHHRGRRATAGRQSSPT